MTTPPDPDAMRAANADRERVVSQLNNAFAEGRLEVAELDERVAKAYAAKTMGELRPLTADLPPAGTVAPRTRPTPERAGGAPVARNERRGALEAVGGMAGIFAINVVIWAVISLTSGNAVYFWPVWILIPVALAVLRAFGVWAGRRDGHGGH